MKTDLKRNFIENLFDDLILLSGDRFYGEDKSVIAGFAKFKSKSVLVIDREKGEDLETRLDRNFGMMRPEGYRKTIRLMNLANKFRIPIYYLLILLELIQVLERRKRVKQPLQNQSNVR